MERRKYQIEVRPSVEKDFRRIDQKYHNLIWKKIDALALNPYSRGCTKLVADEDIYRIRVGVYRIFYSINEILGVICIEHIKHRQAAYKK